MSDSFDLGCTISTADMGLSVSAPVTAHIQAQRAEVAKVNIITLGCGSVVTRDNCKSGDLQIAVFHKKDDGYWTSKKHKVYGVTNDGKKLKFGFYKGRKWISYWVPVSRCGFNRF